MYPPIIPSTKYPDPDRGNVCRVMLSSPPLRHPRRTYCGHKSTQADEIILLKRHVGSLPLPFVTEFRLSVIRVFLTLTLPYLEDQINGTTQHLIAESTFKIAMKYRDVLNAAVRHERDMDFT